MGQRIAEMTARSVYARSTRLRIRLPLLRPAPPDVNVVLALMASRALSPSAPARRN